MSSDTPRTTPAVSVGHATKEPRELFGTLHFPLVGLNIVGVIYHAVLIEVLMCPKMPAESV